ncbi:MFS transporter [Actinotalea sp.]|uniref:MFS transporter n=1 Tax=Actinotalea sp. TaxID=1872145 RepID=UPI002C695941|nr:MFS transporter [Actinotalea sp.]HRA50216.1 MFS transporter [Actinotalea sp.]
MPPTDEPPTAPDPALPAPDPALPAPDPADRGLGPAFRTVFTANLASSLGDGIARTAAPLLAIRLTTDPLLVSGIAALALLPWLLLAIPSGILVDRIDRRRALALANGLRTLLAVALVALAATDALTIWWLYAIVFVYGAGETLYDGAIRAVLPSIVPREALPRANSRIEAGEQIVQTFAAAPLTSALFAVSALIPLGVNGAVYAVAAALAFVLPRAASGRDGAPHPDDELPWRRQLTAGLHFLRGNPMLLRLWLLSSATGLFFSIGTAVFALYAIERLGLPEALFGVLILTGAVGSVLGSVLAPRLSARWGAGPTMAAASVVAALALVLAGAVPTLWALGLAYLVSGGAVLVWNVLVMSLRQSIIPRRLLGRVHGTWRTLLWGVMPLGSLLGGLLGRIDLTVPFLVGGGLATAVGVLGYRFLCSLPNPGDVRNDDDAPEDDAPDDAHGTATS